MAKVRRTRGGGSIRQLTSGKFQARYRWDDGVLHPAPETFETRQDAAAWLKSQADARRDSAWEPPVSMSRDTGLTCDEYFSRWILKKSALAPRTLDNYLSMWRRLISPTFGSLKMRRVSRAQIEYWYNDLDKSKVKGTNDTYALMRQVFTQAVSDKVTKENPAEQRPKIKSAVRDTVILKPEQITQLMNLMPEKYHAAVVIAGWCGLREGELLALRRQDIDIKARRISVTRSVTRVAGVKTVKAPKSRAGIRTVAIPKNLAHVVQRHLETFTGPANSDLFLTSSDGDFLAESSLTKPFRKVRNQLGFPNMRWHDLRHTAGTLATQAGMNMPQVMAFLGHSTYDAAMRYQSAVDELKDYYADKMAALDPNYQPE